MARYAGAAHMGGMPVSELLAQLRAGRREALEALYVELHAPLWRLAMILVRSAETAEEIVQNVFLAIWMRRESIRPEDDIRAYLQTAVRNEARQLARHGRVVDRVASAAEREIIDVPGLGERDLMPDEAAESSEFYEAYQRALTVLTERERMALQLRLEEEMTFDEIGKVLEVSNVGARKIILRAEEKVRALLIDYQP